MSAGWPACCLYFFVSRVRGADTATPSAWELDSSGPWASRGSKLQQAADSGAHLRLASPHFTALICLPLETLLTESS